ncbi:MAG: ion channel [Acidimicrobiales bacterium]|jgi:hypothetical protein|nr:ion channel [Acidimicrobiales bacterium]
MDSERPASSPGRSEPSRRRARLRGQVDEEHDALFDGGQIRSWQGAVRRTDSYGFVLVLLVLVTWVFVPIATTQRWAIVPTLATYYLAIVIALHTSHVERRRRQVAIAFGGVTMGVALVSEIVDTDWLRSLAAATMGLLLLLTSVVVLRRVLSHRRVTGRTLAGAVSTYLFFGLGFASVFHALHLADPSAFTTANGTLDYPAMQYYSFVTLATLGYGDVVPVSEWARSFASLETIAGQIYLVTIVARLVSLFGQSVRTDNP